MNEWMNEWVNTWVFFMTYVCVLYVFCDLQFQEQRIYPNKHTHWIELIYEFWPHRFFSFSLAWKTNYGLCYQSVWEQSAAAVWNISTDCNAALDSSGQLVFFF